MTHNPDPASARNHGSRQDGESPGATWDTRYAGAPWPSNPDESLVALATPLVPGRALDLACGPGRNAIWLARAGWTVTGVDASAVGLSQARARAEEAGVTLELVNRDLLSYVPAPGSFDLVVVANLHLAPHEREALFARAVAAVAPRGHLFVVGHHLDSLGRVGPPFPDRLYTEELLARLVTPLAAQVSTHERPVDDGGAPLRDVVAWAVAGSDDGDPR